MFGNGAVTGKATIRLLLRKIPVVHFLAPIACTVGAAGSSTPASAVCRIASAARRRIATAASACALLSEFPKEDEVKTEYTADPIVHTKALFSEIKTTIVKIKI